MNLIEAVALVRSGKRVRRVQVGLIEEVVIRQLADFRGRDFVWIKRLVLDDGNGWMLENFVAGDFEKTDFEEVTN